MSMLQTLQELEKTFEALTARMGDPELLGNRGEYLKATRRRAELEPVVKCYREYLRVDGELTDTKQMLEEMGGDEGDAEMRELARQELDSLRLQKEELTANLKVLLLPKDPNDEKNVLLEIRAGTGGEEAALFAAEIYRMYSRYAERRGWKREVMYTNETGIGGMKEVAVLVEGEQVYSRLKYESGVHRVQRVPQTEASGRIHTSAITVAVMPEAEEVDVEIDENELRIDRFCSSGPGGQSVNTTYSAIRITHLPTGLVVSCQDEKSQHKNKAKALRVLRSRLQDIAMKEQEKALSATRLSQVGSGDRSEKIRTYNFPQNRVSDHRLNLTVHRLEQVLDGDLDEFIDTLITHDQAEQLKSGATD
jgi:peptide chain release factor 1